MPRKNDWSYVLTAFINSGFIGSVEYQKIIEQHLGEKAASLLNSVE
ncbi:MAG: hypothetical protein L3J29_07115 [Cyclobacteriaceae bacterium]|nr:hypothetical protein [Cyclobacteriaceae bacterium]